MTDPVRIRLRKDGPIVLDGPVDIVDHDGTVHRADAASVALCRCGASERRPFCDGSHRAAGFDGTCRAER